MSYWWRRKIDDDRGRRYPLYDLYRRWKPEIDKDTMRRIWEKFRSEGYKGRRVTPDIVLILLFGVWAAFLARPPGPLSVRAVPIGIFLLALLDLAVHDQTLPFINTERLKPALLDVRLCASCAYRLDPDRLEDDGCTICSECGAAWRLDIGRGSV